MPYFRDPKLDEDEQQQGGGVQLSSSGMQAGPAGSAQGGDKPTQTGSRFTNLDNYLKNNDAQAFGQQFGGKVQGTIDSARNEIDTTAGQVKGQIQQAQAPDQAKIKSYIDTAGDQTTDDQAKEYQGWLNASYKGPKSLADNAGAQDRIQGGANRAATEAKLAGTESGRFSLLDSYFGRPSYNFGQKSLDNLLVQGGGFNAQPLQGQAAQLGGHAKDQEQQIAQQAAQKQGDVEAGRLAARSAVGMQENNTFSGGPMSDIQAAIEARMTDEGVRRTNAYNTARGDVQDDRIDDARTLGYLGLQPGQKLYRSKLDDYLKPGGAPDKYGTATDSEYARYLALSKLAGAEPTYLTADQRKAPRNPQADVLFDHNAFNQKIAQEEADMASESANKKFHYGGSGGFHGAGDFTRDQILDFDNNPTYWDILDPGFTQWGQSTLDQFDRDWGTKRELGLADAIAPTPATIAKEPITSGPSPNPSAEVDPYSSAEGGVAPYYVPSQDVAAPEDDPLNKNYSALMRYMRG